MKVEVTRKEFEKFLLDHGITVSMEDYEFIRAYRENGKLTVQLDGYIVFAKVKKK